MTAPAIAASAHRASSTVDRSSASSTRPSVAGGVSGRAVRVDVVDRRQRLVGRVARREPDRLRAAGEAVEHGDHAADVEALGAHGLDRLHGRAARGDDVLDDQAALARLQRRALDPALEAVLLDVLADEERLHVRAAGERRAGGRVGAHRQPADGGRLPLAGVVGDELGQRGEARRAQDRALGVDVVLRGGAGGERHLADHERVLAQLGVEGLPGGGHRRDPRRRTGGLALTLRAVEHAFGRGESLALGVEEELLLVDPETLALDHRASEILPRLGDAVKPDVYEAEVETASPVSRDAAEAVAALGAVRERDARGRRDADRLRDPPDAPFGEAPHVPGERYEAIADSMRGLHAPHADLRAARPRRHARPRERDPRVQRAALLPARAAGPGGALAVLARRWTPASPAPARSCSAPSRAP